MKQQLRKPENWQDFETLCKKLWGEIWECPEIKKNGRSGQTQHGVDVYGVPKYEEKYYGIQCKGKDEYTHSQLTENEIDEEIKKARTFEPELKKFYFATTSNKDAEIEKYIRKKDLEFRRKGFFEVHLFSWEDIVDLIDENKKTHQWYVQKIQFNSKHSAKLIFRNDKEELNVEVPFRRKKIIYKPKDFQFNEMRSMISKISDQRFPEVKMINQFNDNRINESLIEVSLTLLNNGNSSINHSKLTVNLEGEFEKIKENNKMGSIISSLMGSDILIGEKKVKCYPPEKIIPKISYTFDSFYIKTKDKECDLKLGWHLISEEFDTKGDLLIKTKPTYRDEEEVKYKIGIVKDEIKTYVSDLIAEP